MNVHNDALALLAFLCHLSSTGIDEPTRDTSSSIAGRDLNVDSFGKGFRGREHSLASPAHFSILSSADLNILRSALANRKSKEIITESLVDEPRTILDQLQASQSIYCLIVWIARSLMRG